MELLCLLDFVLSEPEVNFQDSGQLDNQDYQTSTIQKIYNLAFIQEVMGCMLVFWMNFFFFACHQFIILILPSRT